MIPNPSFPEHHRHSTDQRRCFVVTPVAALVVVQHLGGVVVVCLRAHRKIFVQNSVFRACSLYRKFSACLFTNFSTGLTGSAAIYVLPIKQENKELKEQEMKFNEP